MTEEVVVDKVETVVEEAQPSVPELSPVEQQASEQGWVPLETWKESGRDETEWRPAKEFVDRGELYKSIHTTKRELKQTQAALTALQRHHQYVFEKAHQQAIRDLRAEKRLAIRNDDIERLEEIETEIETIQDQHQKEVAAIAATQAQTVPQVAPEFQTFVDKNQWYLTDKTMRDEADAAGFVYLNNGGDRAGLFAHVEREMKRKFPEKLGVRRAAPSAVAGVDRTRGKGPKAEAVNLSAEERQVMMTFVNSGVMTEAEYLKELKKVGR
jgi:hypothetical protein